MNKGIAALLGTQFFSAFADNAILFIVIAMVLDAGQAGSWYVPTLQASFLIAFVVFAPWVGRFADTHAKPSVLLIGSLLKALGVLMVFAGMDALFAYAVIGTGAAIYGPAKYGILPEMIQHDALVKVNGWMEGSTILAIILGTVIGATLADWNTQWALVMVFVVYVISICMIYFIPRLPVRSTMQGHVLSDFSTAMRGFFKSSRARFSMLGASLFWAASAVLRVLLVAWAPLILLTENASDIAALTLYMAIGIVVGAVLVPRLIPIEYLRRARLAAYAMSVFIIALGFTQTEISASIVLFCIGLAGGLFVVPINAALQEIGHHSIGSGGAVAIQNFFENLAMLIAVGIYTLTTAAGGEPVISIFVLGVCALMATFVVSWHLPKDPNNDVSIGMT